VKAAEDRPENVAEPVQHLEDETAVANSSEQVVASADAETAAVSKSDLVAALPL
jgi:hypothetical protein